MICCGKVWLSKSISCRHLTYFQLQLFSVCLSVRLSHTDSFNATRLWDAFSIRKTVQEKKICGFYVSGLLNHGLQNAFSHRFSACNHLEKINCIRTFPRLECSWSCSSSSQLPTLQVRYVIVNTQSMVSFMVIICKKLVQILKYFSDWQHLSFELRLLLCALQSWDSLRLSQLDLRMDVRLIKIESRQIRTWNWCRNRQFLLASLAQTILRPSKELCRGFNQNSLALCAQYSGSLHGLALLIDLMSEGNV